MNETQLSSPYKTVVDRLAVLLNELGLGQVHLAARQSSDWQGLAQAYPERITSLSIICPSTIAVEGGKPLGERLHVVVGDQSGNEPLIRQALSHLPQATDIWITGYESLLWSDIITEQKTAIGTALHNFIAQREKSQALKPVALSEGEGEIAGIHYSVQGSGLPLLLLPLGLAPNQWNALLPSLSERYCTITLSGPHLGMVPMLEARGQSEGYQQILGTMLDKVNLKTGETVLEVGCGTGVIDRWLAQRTQHKNPILGIDFNAYLLKEAAAIAQKEGLTNVITFQEGNAEALSLPDDHVDVAISSTVMEEVDADKMLAEMIRVTKPGGRIGVIVRAMDMPRFFNVPLDPTLKAKIETVPLQSEGAGCASVSLYRRFHQSGLVDIMGQPLLAVFANANSTVSQFVLHGVTGQFSPKETEAWWAAVDAAEAEGTFFFTWPHHCAVGTKT